MTKMTTLAFTQNQSRQSQAAHGALASHAAVTKRCEGL